MGLFEKLLGLGAKNAGKDSSTAQRTAPPTSSSSNQNSFNVAAERPAQKQAVYRDAGVLASGQIRVLERVRTKTHSYHLSRVSLDEIPVYDALSYTWGTSADDAVIEVNGLPFPVTEHLKAAMGTLTERKPKSIWIDAICIDQTNTPEKNAQVQQMTRIYEGAKRVLVWLGGAGDQSDTAFDLLESFGSPNSQRFAKLVVRSFLSQSKVNGCSALARLLARPWWTRAWIFQELVVARKAEIWCGRRSCSWEIFAALAFALEGCREALIGAENPTQAIAEVLANHHHLYNLAVYQRQYQFLCPPSLLQALQTRRQARATDPRDKVFSLLGVCREDQENRRRFRDGVLITSAQRPAPPEGFDVRINYETSHTVAEVYKGVTRHIIRKCGHLDVLSACQNPDRIGGFPSWAPDWSTPRVNGPIVVPDTWGRIYAACGDEVAALEEGRDPDEIMLNGIRVEKIKKFGPPRLRGWDEVMGSWADLSMECAKALPDGTEITSAMPLQTNAHCLYRTGERIADAVLRTCVMDRIEEFRVKKGQHIGQLNLSEECAVREFVAKIDATENRRFAVTHGGFMGLVPLETQPGDVVCIFAGADVPFIIRMASNDWNVIVGESYFHGLMRGEIFDLIVHSAEHKGCGMEALRLR
jgi:hypothetical protein